jgi:predicted PurR-regulated permease PerM
MAADYAWRLLVLGLLAYVVLRLLDHVLIVVVPFTLALLLTAALRPVLVILVRRRVPRAVATIITLLFAIVVIGGIVALVVTRAINEAPRLGTEIDKLIPKVEQWLVTGPLHLDKGTIANFSDTLSKQVDKNSAAIASTAVSTGKTVLDVLAGLVLGVFCTIFLLYDGDRVWRFVCAGFPVAARPRVDLAGRAAWESLTYYVRSTLIVAVFHGVVMTIVLIVLGVPLVAPLALIVAVGSFVPLIGTIVTGTVAVGVAGISQGVIAAVVVVVVLIVDNQVDAHILQPLVIGRYVHIHPLAVVLALATGTIVLGVFGAVIAVPLSACLNSFVRSLKASSREADRLEAGGPEAGGLEADRLEAGGLEAGRPEAGRLGAGRPEAGGLGAGRPEPG